MTKRLTELERKEAALQMYLDSDDLEPGERNDIVASNEVEWEMGGFADDYDPAAGLDKKASDGLIVRARRDAMVAKMNSRDTMATLLNLKIEIEHVRRETLIARWLAVISLAALSYIIVRG